MRAASGVVVSFDDSVGLGAVEASGDSGRYPFHCTQIVDGTRSIPVGVAVLFRVVPGHQGQWEAADLRPISGGNSDALYNGI